jgi:diguanylate cyclase (GGDEF)-like protein
VSATGSFSLSGSPIPLNLWLWAGVTLLLALSIGFAAGLCYARLSVKWAFRRAKQRFSNMYALVLESLDSAEKACALLESFPNLLLNSEQTERLDKTQGKLLATISKVVDGQRTLTARKAERSHKQPKPQEFAFEWICSPESPLSGIPDRAAFDANLTSLLAIGLESETKSGLLFIKVDRFDQLNSRFGAESAQKLLRKMAAVVCRALRDEDLVCQYSPDTFGVLMPAVDANAGSKLALALRNTVRSHHFRLEESGPEVLVTASFGYTTCEPDDNFDLALNRAGNAVAQSQRRGRNHLYVHDGKSLLHSSVG